MRIAILILIFFMSPEVMAGHSGGHSDLHINWFGWEMENPPVGWLIVNFLILFGALGYLLKGRLKGYFISRYESMKRQMEESIKLRDEALLKLKEIEEKINRVEEYKKAIMEQYIDMALKEKEEIVASARRTAQSLINSAKQTIIFETAELKKEILREVVKKAIERSLKIIEQEYTPEIDRKNIEDFVISLRDLDRNSFGYII